MKVIDRLVSSRAVRLVELDAGALTWALTFMDRDTTLGTQITDAALMFVAQREGIETVFTLDRRDFSVYRTSDGRALTVIPEG